MNYMESSARIDAILARMEEASCGVDEVAALVDEASALLEQCREALIATQFKASARLERLRSVMQTNEEIE